MRLSLALIVCTPLTASASIVFEQNPAGTVNLSANNAGVVTTISNLGLRALDATLAQKLTDAMNTGVNGFRNVYPVVLSPANVTITVDKLLATSNPGLEFTPPYPGGGWDFQTRYNSADGLDDWRLIHLIARRYAPDAEAGFANLAFSQFEVDSLDETSLQANLPFFGETEVRNGSSTFGAYDIALNTGYTFFTIRGSFIELSNTYFLARLNDAGSLEVGAAWGFDTLVVVPAPSAALPLLVLGVAARRRR